jgi:hypothetical protein
MYLNSGNFDRENAMGFEVGLPRVCLVVLPKCAGVRMAATNFPRTQWKTKLGDAGPNTQRHHKR